MTDPRSDAPPLATWLIRVFHEIQRNRHVIVHGNVEDLVLWDGEYLPCSYVLSDFLGMAGFQGVAQFDLASGLSYPSAEDAELLRRLMSVSAEDPGSAADSAPGGTDGDGSAEPLGGAPDRAGGELAPVAGGTGDAGSARSARVSAATLHLQQRMRQTRATEPRTVGDLLTAAQRLLTQQEAATALVINSADLVFGAGLPAGEEFRLQMTQLRRLAMEARTAAGRRERLRNTLVLVVKELPALPAWLYRNNPHVAVVAAEPPGIAERTTFLRSQLPRFHAGAAAASPDQAEAACLSLAKLTDGMTVVDLTALVATSQLTRTPITSPRLLVNRHRFGIQEDPWEQLDAGTIRNAEKRLRERVMGQDAAVGAVCDVLINAQVGIDFAVDAEQASTRPKGVFFFVGPTGVGKTELAKSIAQLVFGDESALGRFDMSEYAQEHASERLTGAPPGFVGHEQGGALTNWVHERPFSVVLFDEIEKANPKIFDKFLQILDDGRLTDGQGRTAHFSQAIVIFTSNLGAQELRDVLVDPRQPPAYQVVEGHFRTAVAQHMTTRLGRPELLGRLGSGIVVFDILRQQVIGEIVGKFLDRLSASAARRGLRLRFDRDGIEHAVVDEVMRDGASLGARQIQNPLLEQWVRVPLNRWVFENQPTRGSRIWVHRGAGTPPFIVEALADA